MFVFKFLAEHAVEILAIAGSLCIAGAGFARLTPTDKDDHFFAWLSDKLAKVGTLGLAKSKTKLDA